MLGAGRARADTPSPSATGRVQGESDVSDSAEGRAASEGVILLVEDDPDHAFLVRRRLSEHPLGLGIEHLATASSAADRVTLGGVRCVVLDLSLPDARGMDALHAVRAADPHVPVVVLTGLDSDAIGLQAMQAGAQDYLVKGQHAADAVARAVRFAMERAQREEAETRQALLGSRLQLLLEATAEGICWLDAGGRCTFVNPAAAALVGSQPEDLLGQVLHDLLHVCDAATGRFGCPLRTALVGAEPVDAGEQVFRRPDGSTLVVEVRSRPVLDPDAGRSSVVNFTDVTERRQAQQALAESEAQLSEAQRLARLGSWEWDVRTGEVGWSEELRRLTGVEHADGPHAFARYLALVAEEDRLDVAQLFSAEAAEDPPVVARHRLVRPDGSVRWIQGHMTAAGWDAEGRPTRVLGTMQDITEQKTAEDLLAHQALHDDLTGLVNRGVLLDRLARVLAAPRGPGVVAVVFLDLDQFKWVNDSRSHSAGDALLVTVARALESAVRPTDTLARFGGDEFVVLCEDLRREDDVLDVVERLTAALEQPFHLDELGGTVTVTASMGIATARPGDGTDPEAVVRDADIAMYRAKERGRARFEIFDEDMRLRAAERLQTQSDLRAALQRDEIQVLFQPVVDPRTGLVSGSEALARWRHPTRGLLMPEDFVPHAEESGLIVPLGTSVLRTACATTAHWNRGRPQPLDVAVNLSARQLSHPKLVDTVREALDHSGLPPHLLCLEVTETVVMEDTAASGAVLGRLRELGVRVAIDDFGTGYSSLAYLLSLPVDVLKVDRSFVAAVDGGGPGTAIVTAVVALAQTLGLSVVAEGVETADQRAMLLTLGVGSAQGWLWGRPVAPDEAAWAVQGAPAGGPPGIIELPAARRPAPDRLETWPGGGR
jgi:diguanylate cyclase (GGDEF)-like protein/PAS domain S-box-containing protein